MAILGLEYIVAAPITETNDAITYADGMVVSQAIKADIGITLNEAKLPADNRIVELIKEFKEGKLTLNGDHLSYPVKAMLLGHTITSIGEDMYEMTAKGDDDGAFVGVGFFADVIKNGVKSYRAIWLSKVKFGIPNETLETKGDSIKFQTPTIEGLILTDVTGKWKEEKTFTSSADAKNWLNGKAAITPPTP